jgi:hypothetical protein
VRYLSQSRGVITETVLSISRTVKIIPTPLSRYKLQQSNYQAARRLMCKNCNTFTPTEEALSGSTSASVFLLPPSARRRPSRLECSKGKSRRLLTYYRLQHPTWPSSAWKHLHIRVLSHLSCSWHTLRNGSSTILSQAHCEKGRHTSSMPWFWRCSFATHEHATQILAASRVTGTKTSKPRMLVHVLRQRRLHGSVIAGNARCQSRHVHITARSANGRH